MHTSQELSFFSRTPTLTNQNQHARLFITALSGGAKGWKGFKCSPGETGSINQLHGILRSHKKRMRKYFTERKQSPKYTAKQKQASKHVHSMRGRDRVCILRILRKDAREPRNVGFLQGRAPGHVRHHLGGDSTTFRTLRTWYHGKSLTFFENKQCT